jgi:hypothetical protein
MTDRAPIRVEVVLTDTDATMRAVLGGHGIAHPNTEWRTLAKGSLSEAMMLLAEAYMAFRVADRSLYAPAEVQDETLRLARELDAAAARVRKIRGGGVTYTDELLRICEKCAVRHYENCPDCLGFGVYPASSFEGMAPVCASAAMGYRALPGGATKCPTCGSDHKGVPT